MSAIGAETATNTATVLRFLDHCFAMEIDRAVSMLSEHASWWALGDPAGLRVSGLKDRATTIRMLHGMKKLLPKGMRHRVVGTTAEGNRVAVEVEAEGEWVSGHSYRNHYHFLIETENGAIGRIREYMDTLAVSRLAG